MLDIRLPCISTTSGQKADDPQKEHSAEPKRTHDHDQPADVPGKPAEHCRTFRIPCQHKDFEVTASLPPAADGAELATATADKIPTRICRAHRDWPVVNKARDIVKQ